MSTHPSGCLKDGTLTIVITCNNNMNLYITIDCIMLYRNTISYYSVILYHTISTITDLVAFCLS